MKMMDPNELITTKRIINHRTKQIETRVRRQIVMEDGKVVSDTGPQVTTKTLEDSTEVEELDEQVAETRYAHHHYHHCPHHHHPQPQQWPTAVVNREQQTPVESTARPLKTFVFGEEDQRKAEKEPTESVKCETSRSRPSRSFYFGQQSMLTDEDESDDKEKENVMTMQHQLGSSSSSSSSSSSNSDKHSSKGSSSSSTPRHTGNQEEKDCQFVYEYSDFSRCG